MIYLLETIERRARIGFSFVYVLMDGQLVDVKIYRIVESCKLMSESNSLISGAARA